MITAIAHGLMWSERAHRWCTSGASDIEYCHHEGVCIAYVEKQLCCAHAGLSNDCLVASSHPLALRYNDLSVSENHHCSTFTQ